MTVSAFPQLTRGELAVLLIRDLNMAVERDRRNDFEDLPKSHPHANALLTAVAYDIIAPISETLIDPDGITRVRDAFNGLERIVGSRRERFDKARKAYAPRMHCRLSAATYEKILLHISTNNPQDLIVDEEESSCQDTQESPRIRPHARSVNIGHKDRWMMTEHKLVLRRPLRFG